jgi:uncharacterized protein YcaQ
MTTVPDALSALEFIQMDSINVCGRIHDLVLRSRVQDYRPDDLYAALYSPPRGAFEYYFPNLCALPLHEFRYFVRAMQARSTSVDGRGALAPDEIPLAEALLARIESRGPLRARDAGAGSGHVLSAWGSSRKLAGSVLEKLWLQGRLMVHHRQNFERYFDLPARTLPPEALALLNGTHHLPDEAEEQAFRARKHLRARRLFRPSRRHVQTLGTAALTPVRIEGSEQPWAVLSDDVPALEAAGHEEPHDAAEVNLLAPLDPLVYDRERTHLLFDFDYRWEVYTPQARRRWGYYALPILWGDRLVGRLDPKLDRSRGVLLIQSLQLEADVKAASLAAPLARALKAFAAFLGAEDIQLEKVDSPEVRRLLRAAVKKAP